MSTAITLRPTRGQRVIHRNAARSYGRGLITSVVAPFVGRASKGYVRFDGETADRLVWLDDLSPDSAPAPAVRPTLRAVDLPPVVA